MPPPPRPWESGASTTAQAAPAGALPRLPAANNAVARPNPVPSSNASTGALTTVAGASSNPSGVNANGMNSAVTSYSGNGGMGTTGMGLGTSGMGLGTTGMGLGGMSGYGSGMYGGGMGMSGYGSGMYGGGMGGMYGSGMYGGGMYGSGMYGGMGGMYGGMGGMGGMYGGMGMMPGMMPSEAEQRGHMALMMLTRVLEALGMLANVVQMVFGSALNVMGQYMGLSQQYRTIQAQQNSHDDQRLLNSSEGLRRASTALQQVEQQLEALPPLLVLDISNTPVPITIEQYDALIAQQPDGFLQLVSVAGNQEAQAIPGFDPPPTIVALDNESAAALVEQHRAVAAAVHAARTDHQVQRVLAERQRLDSQPQGLTWRGVAIRVIALALAWYLGRRLYRWISGESAAEAAAAALEGNATPTLPAAAMNSRDAAAWDGRQPNMYGNMNMYNSNAMYGQRNNMNGLMMNNYGTNRMGFNNNAAMNMNNFNNGGASMNITGNPAMHQAEMAAASGEGGYF